MAHKVGGAFEPGDGSVGFWPREDLCEKVLAMIGEQESKLFGTTASTATGMFSRVARRPRGR